MTDRWGADVELGDVLPCGLVRLDRDGLVRAANVTLAGWLGVAGPEELHGRGVTTLYPQAGRLMWHTYVQPMLAAQGEVEEVSMLLQRVDGTVVDVLLNARRADADGGALVVFMRIKERRRLEYQLLAIKRVAEEAPGMLFQLRRSSQPESHLAFTYVTEGVRPLFGVTPVQALADANALWSVMHPDDRAQLMAAVAQSAASLQPWRLEYRVLLDGREQWRETHASPHGEPDGTVLWHGYAQDITGRREMEHHHHEREAAERASQAKSAFLARMSHELRTPLNGILGFARLMRTQGAPLDADQRRKLGYIEAAGDSLLHLVNEVLELSRIEAGHTSIHVQPMEVDPVLRQAMRLVEPLAVSRHVVIVPPVQQGWSALADDNRLLQVLLNLLSNAIKYGPLGGAVTVDVRNEGGRVVIAVQDEGPGLSEAQQTQLFQPFNRLGAERSGVEGVGLGLVITRGLVELMGGELQLRSRPGLGACFQVALQPVPGTQDDQHRHDPWAPTGAGALDPLAPAGDGTMAARLPATARVREVLYVEDNRVNAILMASVFEDRPDFHLTVAETGADALEAARTLRPDVLLLDMHLPDTDGLALLAALRRLPHLAQVPAAVVSADAMPADIERALAAGFAAYWTKPLDIGRLMAELSELVAGAPEQGDTPPAA
ncbi:ATP-binding protein [uncultured Aquabacterium sp.]|jgi:signal transduction histidine kinase/ActR/RegA family two-component response regulator|uniref:hybrid sensor histidine kinase/response regulator n=1 Tax=uncultured Aquabacterium sp. TaxID=158753 RepID=UPI00260EEA50|nr:ATP-binding protein [uncultured Aquabacterium sp.]